MAEPARRRLSAGNLSVPEVREEEVPPTTAGQSRQRLAEVTVPLLQNRNALVTVVARINVEDDEAALTTCADADVRSAPSLPPLANLGLVGRRVEEATVRSRVLPRRVALDLPARAVPTFVDLLQRKNRPPPAGVRQCGA